jgi:POT family proton-dependent oligopeptide transporter
MYNSHPRGTYLLCFTETLERFSFYTMSGLLVLFLTGTPAAGGLGWAADSAIRFYGAYVGVLWLMPLAGGWAADRLLGARRAVYLGGVLIAVGQALMLTPAIFAPIVSAWTHVPLTRALVDAKITLGLLHLPAAAEQSLLSALTALEGGANAARDRGLLRGVYLLPSYAFTLGLACLAIGNGLLKPNITVMLGRLYTPNDPKRDEGFTLFYIAINVGAVLAALVAGTVAESFGWATGFGIASAVMSAGMLTLFALRRSLARADQAPPRSSASVAIRNPLPRRPLAYVVILMLFAAIFWAAFFQMYGLLAVLAYRSVDRSVLGFTVPAAWFSSMTPFFLIALGPAFQAGLRALSRRGATVETPARFTAGLGLAAVAFFFLAVGLRLQAPGALLPIEWPILFYLILSMAELSLSPAGNAMASRHVAAEFSGRLMAIWFMCYAGGSFLSGLAGGLVAIYPVEAVLLGIGMTLAVSAVVFRGLAPRISRLVPAQT